MSPNAQLRMAQVPSCFAKVTRCRMPLGPPPGAKMAPEMVNRVGEAQHRCVVFFITNEKNGLCMVKKGGEKR